MNRCTRPRRFVKVPSSSAMLATGRTTVVLEAAHGGTVVPTMITAVAEPTLGVSRPASSSSAMTSTSPDFKPESGVSERVKPNSSAPLAFAARSRRSARSSTPGNGASSPCGTRNTPVPPVFLTSRDSKYSASFDSVGDANTNARFPLNVFAAAASATSQSAGPMAPDPDSRTCGTSTRS